MPKQLNVKNFILKMLGKTGSVRKRLLVVAAGTFGVRIANIGFTFIISILLARFLGASDFGFYTYIITCAYLLGVPATLGLETLLVREIATYKNQENWNLMGGLLHWSQRLALGFSVGLALSALAVASLFWTFTDASKFLAFCIAMTFLPIASLRNIKRGVMRGLDRVVMGLLPEMLIVPIVQLAVTGLAYLFLKERLTLPLIIAIYVFAAGVSAIASTVLAQRIMLSSVIKANYQYQIKRWFSSSLIFMCLESIYYISPLIDMLMLGWLKNMMVVGIYYPVNRGAQLITWIPLAANTALAPALVKLYVEGDRVQLQKLMTKSARLVFLVALLASAILIGLSHWYLLLFGAEFVQGKKALIICCIGQLFGTGTGSSDMLLNMTGHEKYVTMNASATAVLNVTLNLLLIPKWGIEGAALASTISAILMNIVSAIIVCQKLGIYSTIFGTKFKTI